ncbi:MAG: transcriptional regulator [Chloroflexota bacterium]|nr:transcriptional regulator [Chloroflexota bacterium]
MVEDKPIAWYGATASWEEARRSEIIQEVLCAVKGCSLDLLSFEDVHQRLRLRLSQNHYRGVQEIELDHIRGSVGRYRDFTMTFLPRRQEIRERWERVKTFSLTRGMPPVEVYQVGEAYFVSDGNHRVSVARQAGWKTIKAHVWNIVTPVGLSAGADLDELLIKAEYAEFLERTQLDRLRPDQSIVFTTPGHYCELECQIAMYQYKQSHDGGEEIAYEEAVTEWYDMIYVPASKVIEESGVLARFPGRTATDLFIWVWEREVEWQGCDTMCLLEVADDLEEESRAGFTVLFRRVARRLSRRR